MIQPRSSIRSRQVSFPTLTIYEHPMPLVTDDGDGGLLRRLECQGGAAEAEDRVIRERPQALAIRPQDSDIVFPGGLREAPGVLLAGVNLLEAGAVDDRRANALAAALRDDVGHRLGRRDHQGKVRNFRQRIDRGVGLQALAFGVEESVQDRTVRCHVLHVRRLPALPMAAALITHRCAPASRRLGSCPRPSPRSSRPVHSCCPTSRSA